MKFDVNSVKEVEEREGVILLSKIDKINQYLYKTLRKNKEELLTFEIRTVSGEPYSAKFVKTEGLDLSKVSRRLGRPFDFCRVCENRLKCDRGFRCERIEEIKRNKEEREARKGDERFYKNGEPRKSLTLCRSKKYAYAHKIKEFSCQKEKCVFYKEGKCSIGLDK